MEQIPALFWQGLSDQEFEAIFERDGLLTRAQTLRVWQITGRHNVPPRGRMRVFIAKEELEKWLRSLTKH